MELPKTYIPGDYEADIYALWEKSGAFKPKGKGASYSIVVPPPNANASLHIGAALTLGLEDIAIRYHRLKGDSALFVPGADHAGFETQAVFEKHLSREGKSRFDFSREELYGQIWDFVAENRANFEKQFRQLGASVDWSHFTFTLDDKIIARAYETFRKMWNEGLIYRGERLVNYCTFHGTAFADIEVEYQEEQGKLWYIKYPLTDGSGAITVATTRPETMLGDTAVAVNPSDERYKEYVGKTVKLPLTNREIPVLADEFVDTNFGTGAVKITPAHDPNDFEVGQRHSLPFVQIINHEGKITSEAPEEFRGLTVGEAREAVVRTLEKVGNLEKSEYLTHSVGHCYKCGTVIEPLVMDQWFVDMQPLAKPAIQALKNDRIKFYPEPKKNQLTTYLENLRDWNISRQIAWGIPIPAFQNVDQPDDWIFDERVTEEIIEVNGKTYRRDPDVFDTWFSSGSWPYATLDFPDSDDFKRFYPLSLMETGGEILYQWVGRMIMLGLYITGEIPFREVYIHGYVMAEDGSKMSKSKGNVVNAPEIIERYGADALRLGIIAGRQAAVNRGYDQRKVEDGRNFCNKLWNIARYVESQARNEKASDASAKTSADNWLLAKLAQAEQGIASDLDNYRFSEAYDKLYHFVWDELADWYVEASKSAPNPTLMSYALDATLTLAHPFAPFVTETIWQTMHDDDSLLATSKWPQIPNHDKKLASEFEAIKTIVSEARNIITELGASKPTLYYTDSDLLANNAKLITKLAGLAAVSQVSDGEGLKLTQTSETCWLDVDASAYQKKLAAKLAEQGGVVEKLEARLANKTYVKNAPKEVVAETKSQLKQAREQLAKLETEYARFDD